MQDFTSQAPCVTVNYNVWDCTETNSLKVTIQWKVNCISMMEENMNGNYFIKH